LLPDPLGLPKPRALLLPTTNLPEVGSFPLDFGSTLFAI
jgi:hypothetical protein